MKLAVIGFCYNHQVGIRNIKVFDELSKLGNIEIDLITVTCWGGYKDAKLKSLEKSNFRIHLLKPIFLSNKSIQYRYYMRGLFRKIKEINPDVVYIVNEPLAINTFLAMIYSRILRKKIMCFTWENIFIKKNLPIRIFEKFVLNNIGRFVAGSKDAKKVLIKKGVLQGKITVLPQTGIDTKLFKAFGKRPCNETCLFIGRLEDEKGIEYILAAKRMLGEKGKKYNYLFVGSGKWLGTLQRLSRKDSGVRVIKWVDYLNLPKIYNSASVFLYPSVPTKLWEEQFGYAMAEAMSCGLPVIASDMSGPREIIKDKIDGFIIKPKYAKELSEKIEYLIENERKLKEFSKRAMRNIKRFDNKEIAKKLLQEIKKL
ncbi:glycosyltransferase family 4 protein [Candidatus Woesearchaeota archaeon]|nr:glycosyltransferase family 4 protein [Candidatus Woesearchaeota archaeon]